jgi:hypothetical protein
VVIVIFGEANTYIWNDAPPSSNPVGLVGKVAVTDVELTDVTTGALKVGNGG